MTELLALRGIIEATPDAVTALLLDVRPGGRSPLAVTGDAEPAESDDFTVTKDGSRITVTVDHDHRSVTQQGEWWYRSVTTVEPDQRGSVIHHRIYNIVENHGWAIRFVSRGPLNAAPQSFANLLQQLARELSVPAWIEE